MIDIGGLQMKNRIKLNVINAFVVLIGFSVIIMCADKYNTKVDAPKSNICGYEEEINTKGNEIKLYFRGYMGDMNTKKDVRNIEVDISKNGKVLQYYAMIKIQGTSSLGYEKKNYTIKFFNDHLCKSKGMIDLGWGMENEYCLKANWIDKTHSRNIVTAKLAAEIQRKYNVLEQAPCNGLVDGFPVEVYINDEYHGLYTCNIPKSAWQFGMEESNPNHIVMCGENWEPSVTFNTMPNLRDWSVEVGEENEETLEKFSRLSNFVINSSDEEFRSEFEQYFQLDAMLNYYILVDFAYLPDNCGKNMLMATYDGLIWYPSLYDLDTSWGSSYTGLELWDYKNKLVEFGETSNLANRFEANFSQELHERYFELRKDVLTKEHVLEVFETFDRQISDEWKKREIERWGENIPGYDLNQIEEYLDETIVRLDEKYHDFMNQ